MNAIAASLRLKTEQIAELTRRLGHQVEVGQMGVLDRAGQLALGLPGLSSPNGACRMFRASDGWMALNLAREDDRDLIAAWLGCDFGVEPWTAVARHAPARTCSDLVAGAALLGLPAAIVGEVDALGLEAPHLPMGVARRQRDMPRVVDLSALWAGPLCGAILAEMGAEVVRVETSTRPDSTRYSTPEFYRRLNHAKRHCSLDVGTPVGRADLKAMVGKADILITSARPRAFEGLGLDVREVFEANPGLIWVAITGYGWSGPASSRVGFGDDTAAAGGLVRWVLGGSPHFLGDALADPLAGLSAAIGALQALETGRGVLIDVALARSAAAANALRVSHR